MFPFGFPFGGRGRIHFGLFGGLLRLLLLVFGVKYLVDHSQGRKPVYTPSRPMDDRPQSPATLEATKHSSGPEPAPDPFVRPAR